MLGGIVVAPDRRRQGHSRVLVRHAHELLIERHIPCSILFAYEPRYRKALATCLCKMCRVSFGPMRHRGLWFIAEACTLNSRRDAGQISYSICAAASAESLRWRSRSFRSRHPTGRTVSGISDRPRWWNARANLTQALFCLMIRGMLRPEAGPNRQQRACAAAGKNGGPGGSRFKLAPS